MRIGFDLHGVLEKYPNQLKPILKELRFRGIEIWLISGPPLSQIRAELLELQYVPFSDYFDRFESIVDFLGHDPVVDLWQDERGRWWTDEITWWSTKGLICERNNIDILIDDKEEYKKYFSSTCETDFILVKDLYSIEEIVKKIETY